MAHSRVSKIIGSSNYSIGTLETLALQREVFVRLTHTIGPVLGELLVSVGPSLKGKGVASILDVDIAVLGRPIQDFCMRLDANDLKFLTDAFAGQCLVNGAPLNPDLHFIGLFGEMFEWLAACIAHNYADFYRLLTSGLASRSASPAAQTPKA